MLNIHHLESFYYMARFGGLTHASRQMPYGTTQPTLSRQLRELEEEAASTLCERRPFRLTPSGEILYAVLKPLFESLEGLPKLLKACAPVLVRIAGPPVVLRDSLPPILRPLAVAFPNVSFHLKAGLQEQILEWFENQQIDVAITILEGKPPESCQVRSLLNLAMALLVPSDSKLRSAEELFQQQRITERLITPPANDAICKYFELGLRQHALDWPSRIEMNSIELVEGYVAKGFGIGLTLLVPGCRYIPDVRVLPLPNFPSVPCGLIWRRQPDPITLALMGAMEQEAQLMRQQQDDYTFST